MKEWLWHQELITRNRAKVDTVEWDPTIGLEVIEERLPREACIARLKEHDPHFEVNKQ